MVSAFLLRNGPDVKRPDFNPSVGDLIIDPVEIIFCVPQCLHLEIISLK